MTRVVQISDTHLSRGKAHFARNWRPLVTWVTAQRPDLIIHTGDVTVDGADVEDDLAYCAELMKELPAPVLAVPGNHDVGEAKHAHQPVDRTRIDRWRRHFGPDWWVRDVEGWRLVGLNSMLFGSDEAAESEQRAWLEQTLRTADGRRIAWFTHRPFFIESHDEPDTGYWSVKPDRRADYLDLAARYDVALVATGHLHKSHDRTVGARRYIWGASSGFVVGEANQPEMPGEKRLGAVTYDFNGNDVAITRSEIGELAVLWIDDVLHDVYPPRRVA